jgi:hypothetical protein
MLPNVTLRYFFFQFVPRQLRHYRFGRVFAAWRALKAGMRRVGTVFDSLPAKKH